MIVCRNMWCAEGCGRASSSAWPSVLSYWGKLLSLRFSIFFFLSRYFFIKNNFLSGSLRRFHRIILRLINLMLFGIQLSDGKSILYCFRLWCIRLFWNERELCRFYFYSFLSFGCSVLSVEPLEFFLCHKQFFFYSEARRRSRCPACCRNFSHTGTYGKLPRGLCDGKNVAPGSGNPPDVISFHVLGCYQQPNA